MSKDDKNTGNLDAKRAAVLSAKEKSRSSRLPALLVAVAIVGVLAVVGMKFMAGEKTAPAKGASFAFVPTTGEVTYPVADFKPGLANFYQQKAPKGVVVRYFVVMDEAGAVSAGLDACQECWQTGKGHRQVGEELICQNCSKSFGLDRLGASNDPCEPFAVPAKVRDGQVVIDIPDLIAGAKYFKKI